MHKFGHTVFVYPHLQHVNTLQHVSVSRRANVGQIQFRNFWYGCRENARLTKLLGFVLVRHAQANPEPGGSNGGSGEAGGVGTAVVEVGGHRWNSEEVDR